MYKIKKTAIESNDETSRSVTMIRKKVGILLFLIGFIVMGISLAYYLNISTAQSNMLKNQEEPVVEARAQAAVADAGMESATAMPAQPAPEIKTAKSREDYQSGEMVMEIPKLKVKAAIVDGTSREVLKEGPGLYEISPMPDEEGGNVCIAGHRTTYGAWFRHVEQLKKGDEIKLIYAGASYIYQVEKVFVVDKKDWSVTEPQGYSAITLTACHPLGSAKQRIVVRGKLIE